MTPADVLALAREKNVKMVDFRFTELSDDVENYGWDITVPLDWGRSFIEVTAGAMTVPRLSP